MTPEFAQDAYGGNCEICGEAQRFERTQRAIRETYRCGVCKGSLRERAQAAVIVSCFPQANVSTLKELVKRPEYEKLRVYEPGVTGSLRKWLCSATQYCQSDYLSPEYRYCPSIGIAHQDLEALTFNDACFDLVVSSDILEHVRHPEVAFREIARVLKSGGLHIFTVPMQDPLRNASVRRVDVSKGEDVHILPPRYHGDGKGGQSLVYTDFGADIEQILSNAGFRASLVRYSCSSAIASRVITVLARAL